MEATHRKTINGYIALIYDICIIPISWMLSYWLRFNLSEIPTQYFQQALHALPAIIFAQIILFKLFDLHRGVWHFASIPDLIRIIKSSILGAGFALILFYFSREDYSLFHGISIPLSIPFLYGLLLIGFLSIARLMLRIFKNTHKYFIDYKKVIIVGAGKAGEGLVRELLRNRGHSYKPIIFVDDDLSKLGKEIHGIRVEGTTADLQKLIKKYKIDLALIAMPSASTATICSIVDQCEKTGMICYTLPTLRDITEGHISVNTLRNISLSDLLGRHEININWEKLICRFAHKTILVTGGGGSIGAELCRQLVTMTHLSRLIIVDNNEYNLYLIERELKDKYHFYNVVLLLASVTDRVIISHILGHYKPQIIFHAAAYKHVPLLEQQVRSAIYNNLIGTKIIAEEAMAHQIESFILISSDKAVNPTNIMGATKRGAEYICQSFNAHSHNTRFVTVRFGNVLDSTGSVVPLFRKQIEMGGPVTVTHPEMMRYFMTIPEAAQLILQATLLGKGGEIFVLDMGNPVKIRYLAEQMIKLAGKSIDKDIQIIYIGLRPGEKLYEECFYAHEELQSTSHAKIKYAIANGYDFKLVSNICNRIEHACNKDDEQNLINLLHLLVPEYLIAMNQKITEDNEHITAT